MNQETSSSYLSLLITFIAGAAIGGVVVALSTPKSGPDLRRDIKDAARRAGLKASAMAEDASEAWETGKDRTALAAADIKRGFTDAAQDLRG